MGKPRHRNGHKHRILPGRFILHTTQPNKQKRLPATLRSNLTLLRQLNGASIGPLCTRLRNTGRHRNHRALVKPFYTLLHEAPKTLAKSKRRMARVSKEYSGIAILVIFMLLVTNLAFSPQTGGTPRAISQAYVPTAISASSLPVGGTSLTEPVGRMA